jgi:hypothetical protein
MDAYQEITNDGQEERDESPGGFSRLLDQCQPKELESQDGHTSRVDGGHNTLHPFGVRETIKHKVEDVMSCVHQKTLGLRKELTKHKWIYRP